MIQTICVQINKLDITINKARRISSIRKVPQKNPQQKMVMGVNIKMKINNILLV